MKTRLCTQGFGLIEMMLISVIVSVVLLTSIRYSQQKTESMRVDRAALQMQQILNAGLAFYVKNGVWPSTITILQTNNYLPPTRTSGVIPSPWGTAYTINSTNNIFSATLNMPTGSQFDLLAKMIAGKLPLATVKSFKAGVPANSAALDNCIAASTPPGGLITVQGRINCEQNFPVIPAQPAEAGGVTASVNIPGQDLNNATALNFAGVFHHGACVPVPTCPVDIDGNKMSAHVFVIPVSVSGLNDSNSMNVYPISSYTGFAKGPSDSATLESCTTSKSSAGVNCGASPTNLFWRVCVQVITQRGSVNDDNNSTVPWGSKVTMAVFTRCAVDSESTASDFTVFTN